MNKLLILILVLLTACNNSGNLKSCNLSEDGKVKTCATFYKNGQKKIVFEVKEQDSLIQIFYEDGDFKYAGNYYKKKPIGIHYYFERDSILKKELTYNLDYSSGDFKLSSVKKYNGGVLDKDSSWYYSINMPDTINYLDSIPIEINFFSPIILDSVHFKIAICKVGLGGVEVKKVNNKNVTKVEYMHPPLMDTGKFQLFGSIDNFRCLEKKDGTIEKEILYDRMKIYEILYSTGN